MLPTKLLQLYISISYVLAIYFSTSQHVSHKQRNEPQIIRQRMKNIMIICGINVVLVPLIVSMYSGKPFSECLLQIGIVGGYHFNGVWDIKQSIVDCVKVITLVAILYVGPLIDLCLHYVYTNDSMWYDLCDNFNDIWGVRNYVFAPISEELVYTSMLLGCHIAMEPRSQLPWTKLLLEPSVYFGIAHVHHAWEMYQDGDYKFVQIVLITTFQAIYTTMFGTFSNYIFLRHGGSLYSCILVHTMCNLLGVPALQPSSNAFFTSLWAKKCWSRGYLALLLLGFSTFCYLLGPMTASPYSF
ncbi:CAAX prenyl protease 2 [Monosporozyma servazzii]